LESRVLSVSVRGSGHPRALHSFPTRRSSDLGKWCITTGLGFIFPQPARTMLIVAAGLSQIGEFSFIVGSTGLALGILDRDQYSLILAGSLLSIMVNPFMFRTVPHIERFLQRMPAVWDRLNHQREIDLTVAEKLDEHVVVIGYGRVGQY